MKKDIFIGSGIVFDLSIFHNKIMPVIKICNVKCGRHCSLTVILLITDTQFIFNWKMFTHNIYSFKLKDHFELKVFY